MVSDARIGLVTGANQGLGRAVVAGLARAWGEQGTVYLTGRDRQRVEETAATLARDGLRVVPQVPPARSSRGCTVSWSSTGKYSPGLCDRRPG